MQTARLFLISPPPRWLRGVLCHVFAGLRFNAKVGPRLLTFILSLINKNGFQPVPNSGTTLFLLASDALPLPSWPHLALSSIAAPTTATVFLLVSLSKMPRSIANTLKILPRGISDQG